MIVDVSHASVLPWVLLGVEEVDVFASDVEATKLCFSLINSWPFQLRREDSLTIIKPEKLIQGLRSEWINYIRQLESAKLCAVLISETLATVHGPNCPP